MPRGPYGYGGGGDTGLGDIAAIGQGLFAGAERGLDMGSKLHNLLLLKEEAKIGRASCRERV